MAGLNQVHGAAGRLVIGLLDNDEAPQTFRGKYCHCRRSYLSNRVILTERKFPSNAKYDVVAILHLLAVRCGTYKPLH